LAIALIYAISMLLWTGDLDGARRHIDWFVAHAQRHALAPYLAVGLGFKGRLAILEGDPKAGVENLQTCLAQFHAMHYELLTTPFQMALAEGLAGLERRDEAIALMDDTIKLCETNGDLVYMPELLRAKGGLLLAGPGGEGAEQCFKQSLDLSRGQGARGCELRTAIDYASLLAARKKPARAREILLPVFETFTEGAETADLKAAMHLLATL
jgi:hypothetical protein